MRITCPQTSAHHRSENFDEPGVFVATLSSILGGVHQNVADVMERMVNDAYDGEKLGPQTLAKMVKGDKEMWVWKRTARAVIALHQEKPKM